MDVLQAKITELEGPTEPMFLHPEMHSKSVLAPPIPKEFPEVVSSELPSATALPEEVGERRSPDEVERSEPEPRRTEQQPAQPARQSSSEAALEKARKEELVAEKAKQEKEQAEGLAAGQVRLEQGHHELTKKKAALDEVAKDLAKQRKTLEDRPEQRGKQKPQSSNKCAAN